MVLIIFLSILVLILLTMLIPIKIKFNFNLKSPDINQKTDLKVTIKSGFKIYIWKFLRVAKIENVNKEKESKNSLLEFLNIIILDYIRVEKVNKAVLGISDLKKLHQNIYIKEATLNLGYNTQNPIGNAYAVAAINTAINMYLMSNYNRINISKIEYQTFISNKTVDLDISGIIDFDLGNTIHILIKIMYRLGKAVYKNGRTTSNRELNVNGNDIN